MEGREDMIFFATVDVTRFGVCLARYGDFQRHVGWGGNWFNPSALLAGRVAG